MSLPFVLYDSLPDQVISLLQFPKQYRSRAEYQPISLNFDEAFLFETDPVGEQAELHMLRNLVSPELVAATISYIGVSGLSSLLCASAK